MTELDEPHEGDSGDAGGPHVVVHRRLPWLLAVLVAVPLLLFTLWAGITLHWNYSVGTRAGVLQKFSRKGWLCKTWEGELAMTTVPGVAPTLWTFSVRDPRAADAISAKIGERVRVHYAEHRGVPTSCFGDTQYYVYSVSAVPVEHD